VKNLPDCQEHSVVWGALLVACRKHDNDMQLVELSAQCFFRLQPGNTGKYIVLSNTTYAAGEMWGNVASAYEVMNALGMWGRIQPGTPLGTRQETHFLVLRRCRHNVDELSLNV
jgi:hypothetical protein